MQLANVRSHLAGNGLSDIFSECFPDQIDGRDNRKRLLDLTRHTPRDFLQLLTNIQQFVKPDLDESYVTRSEILSGERSYSLN